MARATQTTTKKKTAVSVKPKTSSLASSILAGANAMGSRPCNICHGTGKVPTSNWKKKK